MEPGTLLALAAAVLVGVRLWDRWLWRLPALHPWPVRRPDLEGTWAGFLQSTWRSPETGARMPSIDACLVVRQTFWGLRASLITRESRSQAILAGIHRDEEGCHLWIVYRNEPQLAVQDRSRVHRGCALLRLGRGEGGAPTLEGPYWTDRETAGELRLHRITREHLDDRERAMEAARLAAR